ncbi:sensor histidine kinase [Paenibacillus sp. Marseille-Q4541]|uniref:cache domain-containing sensor histidine kinase n=1 Tax=Paenibacillus sp. Marseille-Q4541 TaxID=2831522 RepID=UPI001BA7A92E|nr:sensor histidine kinase [Paenibacillus sp. Marseille-Q4541]
MRNKKLVHQIFRPLHSIVVQLFLLFFIGMTVPVLVMGFLSYEKSASIVEEQVSKVASLTITQVSDKLDMLFKKIDDSSMMLLSNKVVHSILEEKDADLYASTLKVKEGKDFLTSVMINSPEILDIYIFDIKQQNSVLSADSFNSPPDHSNSWWYQEIVKANGSPVWFGLTETSYLKQAEMGFPVFGLGRAIRSWESGEIIGVMFFEIMGDVLIKELDKVQFGETGYVVITNDEKQYFYHPDKNMYGKISELKLPLQMMQFHEGTKSTLMIPEKLDNGWYVHGIVPLEELTADSASIRNFTVWIVFVAILLAIGVGYYATLKIGNPLVQLSRLMRMGEEGDLTVRSRNVGQNEIGQLGRSFNKMIEQINVLIHRIASEEREKKKAEIRALRYQINPHFLYNTLNSIRWLAKLNRVQEVDHTVTTLVHLLEGSLERNGVFIRLGDELDLLRKYMIIQEYRYDHMIHLQITCSKQLEELPIPRMLLQPIVENAIFHGIAPKDDEGSIHIQVEQKGTDILIIIEDDGIGMSKERAHQILADDGDRLNQGMINIGIRHVNQTVKLYYGEEYGVQVESEEGSRTRVVITLSTMRREPNVQSTAG